MSTLNWSPFSEAIFDTFLHTTDNIIVQACPGAGKTTNIKHIWTLDDKATLYLVFNKHNQLEAEAKLPVKAASAIKTLNGFGHMVLSGEYGRVQLDSRKVYNIIKSKIHFPKKVAYEYTRLLAKLVSKAKMSCLTTELSYEQYAHLLADGDLEEYEGMYADACMVLEINDNMRTVIDFDDQIRLPAIYNVSMPTFKNILVDEAQDLSPIQAEMIARLQGRYVIVGDRHQSIYGFRGAMNNSMDFMKAKFDCVELPLSITYRCAQKVVREAQKVFNDIEAWQESPQGIVRYSKAREESFRKMIDSIVLCRLNKPLIDLAYDLLEDNIACHVRGRDIGENIVRLINRQEASNVRQLIDRLTEWRALEVEKALAKDNEMRVESVNDKFESAMLFIKRCDLFDSVHAVVDQIDNVFTQGKGICLSTVHKAKGLEAKRCMLLEHDLMPFQAAKKQWEKVQEENIKYVAITRAKEELVYM